VFSRGGLAEGDLNEVWGGATRCREGQAGRRDCGGEAREDAACMRETRRSNQAVGLGRKDIEEEDERRGERGRSRMEYR